MQCKICNIEMQVQSVKDDKFIFVCPKCKETIVVEKKDIKPSN